MSTITHSWAGTSLVLDPSPALYWPEKKILFVTDLHLGKVGHFHKEGIAIPGQVVAEDYARLDQLIRHYDVQKWICLGDLFHSHWNQEVPLFIQWRQHYRHIDMILIEGNHDRYCRKYHDELAIKVVKNLIIEPFYLSHDWRTEDVPSHLYALSGHLHPAIRLYGKGRQQLKLPCFWFQQRGAYLPAFGQLTGTYCITPHVGDQIFILAGQEIKELPKI